MKYVVTFTSTVIDADSPDEAIERAGEFKGGGSWEAVPVGVPFEAHIEELEGAMWTALRDAHEKHPSFPLDELYVASVWCDGQYATVTVGMANVSDHRVIVNTDTGKVVTE